MGLFLWHGHLASLLVARASRLCALAFGSNPRPREPDFYGPLHLLWWVAHEAFMLDHGEFLLPQE